MDPIGADGSLPNERISKYCSFGGSWGESIAFGGTKPKQIVEYLIVSDGIPSRGNRKNIFTTDLSCIGVAVGPHTDQDSVTVLDLAARVGKIGDIGVEIQLHVEEEIPEHLKKKLDAMDLSGKVHVDKKGQHGDATVKGRRMVRKSLK